MNEDDKIYVFEYPFSKEQFLNNIPNGVNYYNDNYIIEKKNGMIFVGIERLGHSSGRWYVGKLCETEGKTLITGKFVIDPDDNGNTTYQKNNFISFAFIISCILLSPIYLLALIGYFFFCIYKKISRKTYNTMTNEERLNEVMLCHFSCKKKNYSKDDN